MNEEETIQIILEKLHLKESTLPTNSNYDIDIESLLNKNLSLELLPELGDTTTLTEKVRLGM